MKDYINLLPQEFVYKPNPWFLGGVVAGAVLGVLLLIYGGLLFKIYGLRTEVHELSENLARVMEARTEQSRLQSAAMKTDKVRQLAAVKGRLSEEIIWSSPLREISLIIPDGIVLNKIESFDPPAGAALDPSKFKGFRIQGRSVSYFRITDFMTRLQKNTAFGKPFLTGAETGEATEENRNRDHWIRFEVVAPVRKDGV